MHIFASKKMTAASVQEITPMLPLPLCLQLDLYITFRIWLDFTHLRLKIRPDI